MILRQKAEELLKDKPSEQEAKLLDAEILKLVHELEVYKIELERQYEEFIKAKKEQETIASEKYIELYNLEPTGYFTLSRNGEIIQLNNSGAKMLGKDKSQLENRLFHLFVSDNSKPTFLFFLGKVFTSGKNESCELTLSTNDDMPVYVYLTGIVSKNSDNCLITVIDITERKLLESSLIEKMIMLSETERAGKIGGWTIDVKTFTQNWTLETFKIFEIDTIRGEPNVIDFIEMIDGPFRLNAELVIKRAVEFGEPFNYEWKMTTVKGNKRWINAVGKANIVNGKTVSLSGAFQDISERKQAEEALLESELKFRNIFENSPVGISMTNLDGFLNVNNAFCSILGYSKEELSKLKWQDITYPDDIIKTQEAIDSLLSGVNLNIRFEKRYIHKNGNTIWAHLSSTLQSDMNGKPLYLMTTIIDITEKKQTEALLVASEKKYHSIFDNVQDVFYQTDLAGTVLDVSPSIKILSGFNRDEIIDKPVTNLYYDLKDRDKVLGLLKDDGELRDFELRLKTNTGELKFVSINARLIFDSEGKPNHIDGAIRNITDRKLAEIELQASKDFLNSIINAVASPVFVKDENHKCVLVNNALSSFLEIPKEKIIGSTDSEYFPEEQVKVFIEKENEVLKTGKENCSEEFVTDKTGNVRTIVTRKTLYTDTAGNKFLVGVINDITERKLSENALKKSQMLLKASIESPKDMIILSIDKQYKYLNYNTFHKNVMLSAYGSDIELGMNLLDCINNEDDIIKSKINYGRAFNGESHTTIEEYGELNRYYYETRYNPILNDKKEVIGATAFSSNITERILAEKQIERLNRVYTVLSNINKTIIRVRDKQLLFEEACRIAVENGGFKMAWMGMVNPATNKIDVVTSFGNTGEFVDNINIDLNNNVLNSGPAGQAIKSGKCNFSNNIQTDDRIFYWREKAMEYGFRSIIALPVIVWGKTIGVYMIYSGEINFFNEDEIKLLEEMASDISFAVEFIESDKELKLAEKALRKSEAIQSKIVSNIGDVIVIIDKDGINRYKSPNIETLFGWKPEDLVGKSTWNIVHPDDLDSAQKIVAEIAMIPNATETTEIRYRRKDGEYVWIEVTIVNLLSDPDIQGFLGNYHDITDRRLAQAKIREKDLEFKKLSSNLPDLIFQFTRSPNGAYYVPIASEGIKNIFGCSPEDVINDFTPISRVIHTDDVERVIADIEYSAKHLTYFTCEFRVIIPGKPIQWIYSKSTPEKLPDGSVTWYGFNADITERKRVEDSLVKLKTAMDKSEISVVITDRNGIIEYANPFFNKLTGYSPDEYIGKTPGILKSAFHPKEFYDEMWYTILSGNTWEGEFYNCKKNGEMYWENAIISPIANNKNEITHFVAIKTDITHAKNINSELIIAKERAEESDRLKSAFLANMSHEIRTPMNGILGFTELLKEPDLADDQRKYFIGIIEKSGERLLNIINDIIDISKIESGQMKVKNSGINVNEYLDQILTFFKPEAEAKNIKLICKPGLPAEEAFLETDSEKFYAILINLVKNALKYTETGFVEFGYNRVAETQCIASLQFYVKDTGIGIPKDRQEAIFERFVQADILDKMARQGAGLGLSISKAYVEMLGGNIRLESEAEDLSGGKSGGSTFYFTLPIPVNPESENNTVKILNPVKDVQINPKVSGLKILIAEDDEPSSKFISISVREFGNEIIKVQTGREAVDTCHSNPDIDLILMDIQMPELSGYDAPPPNQTI